MHAHPAKLSIGIVGAGALGTIFADGLRTTSNVLIASREAVPSGFSAADIVVVAVKTYDTIAALGSMRDRIPTDAPILTLQNGIEQVAQIEAALGAHRAIVLAPTTEAATRDAGGAVRREGRGRTTVGWSAQRRGTFDLDEFAATLRESGLDAVVASPIEPYVWGKLVVSAAINPVTALARRPNGFIVENAVARKTAAALVREVAAVAAAEHIALPFDDPVAYVLEVARATSGNRSSMLQDVERNRPTEIDAINGAIVRRGRALGVATPENARVLDEVRRIAEA